jgi:hypothetical protein
MRANILKSLRKMNENFSAPTRTLLLMVSFVVGIAAIAMPWLCLAIVLPVAATGIFSMGVNLYNSHGPKETTDSTTRAQAQDEATFGLQLVLGSLLAIVFPPLLFPLFLAGVFYAATPEKNEAFSQEANMATPLITSDRVVVQQQRHSNDSTHNLHSDHMGSDHNVAMSLAGQGHTGGAATGDYRNQIILIEQERLLSECSSNATPDASSQTNYGRTFQFANSCQQAAADGRVDTHTAPAAITASV